MWRFCRLKNNINNKVDAKHSEINKKLKWNNERNDIIKNLRMAHIKSKFLSKRLIRNFDSNYKWRFLSPSPKGLQALDQSRFKMSPFATPSLSPKSLLSWKIPRQFGVTYEQVFDSQDSIKGIMSIMSRNKHNEINSGQSSIVLEL